MKFPRIYANEQGETHIGGDCSAIMEVSLSQLW